MTKTKYKVAKANSLPDLENKVNDLLSQGWEVSGVLTVVPRTIERPDGLTFYQSMTLTPIVYDWDD